MNGLCKTSTELLKLVMTMKLLVVVDTLNGSRIARSIASTFTTPDPMPSSADRIPANSMTPNPIRTRCTTYGTRPGGSG